MLALPPPPPIPQTLIPLFQQSQARSRLLITNGNTEEDMMMDTLQNLTLQVFQTASTMVVQEYDMGDGQTQKYFYFVRVCRKLGWGHDSKQKEVNCI